MPYTVDRVSQLEEALKLNRFGSVASLRAAGVTSRQHNANLKKAKKTAAAKSTTKKTVSAKPTAKKSASAKPAAKKTTAKKAAKSTATKKS